MTRRHLVALTIAAGLVWTGCGTSDGEDLATSDQTPPTATAPEATAPAVTEASESAPIDGFRPVDSVEEIAGIWMPVEVAGETVDAAALGAYLQIAATDERVRIDGFDGCNRVFGNPTGVRPAFDDGRFAGMEFGSTMQGCDISIDVLPEADGRLYVSDDGAELLADEVPFTGSIRYERVDAVPVDPREAVQAAADEADEAARQAEEAAEQEALADAEIEARETIRTELPLARTRWAESGINSYTLRFEVGALLLDPSFPQRQPVGGVWEIEVVDGVATDNEWSVSVLGDTVDDWFAYVDSQLDSHYLRVEFDPELGFPRTIDSQPLDDAVNDPNDVAAWIVFAEVEPLDAP